MEELWFCALKSLFCLYTFSTWRTQVHFFACLPTFSVRLSPWNFEFNPCKLKWTWKTHMPSSQYQWKSIFSFSFKMIFTGPPLLGWIGGGRKRAIKNWLGGQSKISRMCLDHCLELIDKDTWIRHSVGNIYTTRVRWLGRSEAVTANTCFVICLVFTS